MLTESMINERKRKAARKEKGGSGISQLQLDILTQIVLYNRDSYPDEYDVDRCYRDVKVRSIIERCFGGESTLDNDKPYEMQMRNRKQSIARAIRSLIERDLLCGIALAWCNVSDQALYKWAGGSKTKANDDTPQIKIVSITTEGYELVIQKMEQSIR
jgi:hypothetical protein